MPQIPTFVSRQPIEPALTPPNRARLDPDAAGAGWGAIARAAERTTAVTTEMLAATVRAQQETALTQARTQMREQLADARIEAERDQDPVGLTDRWHARSRALASQIEEGIGDSAVRGRFRAWAMENIAGDRVEVARLETRRTQEAGRAALDQELEQQARRIAAMPVGPGREAAIAEVQADIASRARQSFIAADDARTLSRGFGSRLDTAAALSLMNSSPAAAARLLADPNGPFRNLTPEARERLALSAGTRADAQAARAESAAARAEARAARVEQARADEAEKAFDDALRAGDVAGIERALDTLRRSGRPGAYRSAAERYLGNGRELPTTPQMESWAEGRLRDRQSPLTRDELEQARGRGQINETVYRNTLRTLAAREDGRFREAEQFLDRHFNVPSSTIADRDLQPWQREAQRQRNAILNDFVLERQRNPDADPMTFVRQRLESQASPETALRVQRAREQIARLPPEARTPEQIDALAAQVAHWQAYRSLGWFDRQSRITPEQPTVTNPYGQREVVTPDMIARWRRLHEDAGTLPAASREGRGR